MQKRILLLLVSIFSIAVSRAETEYEFKVKEPEDTITVTNQAERTTFVVTSASGIGRGSIALGAGAWSRHVVIRLKGFKSLEGFTLSTSKLRVEGSLRESGKMPFCLADAAGKFDPQDRLDRFAGYLGIVVERRDDGLEIILPANLLADANKFEVEWIDVHRR